MELPESTRFNMIMTVVSSVSKKAYFIPTHIIVTIESITRLFLYYVLKLYGLSTHIELDKGL